MSVSKHSYYEIYVSADDEVTTVISRMRLAQERRIVLIIPQRALLLQSVINLRLMDREAKKQQKELLIVTQDEAGAALAERIGLRVEPLRTWQQMHDTGHTSKTSHIQQLQDRTPTSQDEIGVAHFSQNKIQNTQPSMHDATDEDDGVVSSHQEDAMVDDGSQQEVADKDYARTGVVRKTVTQQPRHHTRGHRSMDVGRRVSPSHDRQHLSEDAIDQSTSQQDTISQEGSLHYNGTSYRDDDFSPRDKSHSHTSSADTSHTMTPKKRRSFLRSLRSTCADIVQRLSRAHLLRRVISRHDRTQTKKVGIAVGALIIFVGIMMSLPHTVVTVTTKNLTQEESLRLTAQTQAEDVDIERRIIPARLLEKDVQRVVSISPTGPAQSQAQKAQGTITIINTFSSAKQPLVATTRFLAQNGVLFRLINPVIVPGTTRNEAGEIIPGKIDARVMADAPGAQGNIAPTTFTIPGFAGGPKAEKIYAQSDTPMTGGTAKEDTLLTVTQEDIAQAKQTAEENIDQYVRQELEKLLQPGEQLLADAFAFDILSSESGVSAGDAVPDPTYRLNLHVRAIVFDEGDVQKIVARVFASDDQPRDDVTISYGEAKPLYDEGTMVFHVIASRIIDGTLDTKAFRARIAGMTHDQLSEIIHDQYPIVQDVSLQVFPTVPRFLSDHISRVPLMTKVVERRE